ncbi:MAG TPA: hypothetical protein DCL80_04350 [Balneola sp.]|jgi:hypothetical protein|nr:hypothetical protein [Balneola sp.]MBF64837.1 hypothetical protein [Balneola sp.]HAH50526.1 hypothetical protein [Balneola sp.]HAW79410.1 hypothetical protein [Balneola sp.]HBZ37947.1 hypothetical protein [Balneola sp.]|tara:strand:- start:27409 stop:28125 length:717 start_codon:yes stop_codon:yes gene_type:complete
MLNTQNKFGFNRYLKWLLIIPCWLMVIEKSFAQGIEFDQPNKVVALEEMPNPKTALLLSFVVPGLGHQYVDNENWSRGKIHLGSEIALMAGYFGLNARANRLEGNLSILARSKAGVSLANRNREFELAVANFDNLAEYNDFQLRTRRWQNILPDTPENRWNWESDNDRFEFRDTRDRIANSENQLPTLLTLMVANRLLSGINAFTRARNLSNSIPVVSVNYINEFGERGVTANFQFNF